VVVQFAILIGLILATATIYRQTQFALSQGLGSASERILIVQDGCNNRAFPDEVRKLPGVEMAACTSLNALASPSASNITNVTSADGIKQVFSIAPVDFQFFETFDIKPLAGRVFDRSRGNDGPLPLQAASLPTTVGQQPGQAAPPATPPAGQPGGPPRPPPVQFAPRPVMLNEAAVIALGYASPQEAVGKTMMWQQPGAGPAPLPSEIIGVIKDIPINIGGKATPHFYFIAPQMVSRLAVKTTGEDLQGTVSEIQRIWKATGNTRPIQLVYFAESRRVQYLDIVIQGVMIGICALAAVTIACLGLFALSAFAAERRTREIGVRKALGATTGNVIGLLMWQFTVPVLWAIVIALPIGYLLMTNWLQGFAYHVDLDPWLFALAAGAALAVAWITVSVQTYLVARAKPVKALRHD
jgi:putative ABC transport system permease protein